MSDRTPAAEWLVRPADRDVLSDHHGVLGDDLDRAVVLDVLRLATTVRSNGIQLLVLVSSVDYSCP